jgi:ABC-2 type transport system permease protein
MLGVSGNLIAIHEVCCVMLCMGLSGIAVGLGARMPDLRESSPAKISSGFGGTLCLVLSSLFIMVVVIVAAVPTHLSLATSAFPAGARRGLVAWATSPQGFAASLLVVVALGLVATFVPLVAGIRSFRRLEP